jgi:hypothetical protein
VEAFESFVAAALEAENFVVSGGVKFRVKLPTRKATYIEEQSQGYEVDLVGARADRLVPKITLRCHQATVALEGDGPATRGACAFRCPKGAALSRRNTVELPESARHFHELYRSDLSRVKPVSDAHFAITPRRICRGRSRSR